MSDQTYFQHFDQSYLQFANLTLSETSVNSQNAELQSQLQQFESLCSVLYSSTPSRLDQNQPNRQEAELMLNSLKALANIPKLMYFLQNSVYTYAQYLSASFVKEIFTKDWSKIELLLKVQTREQLLQWLIKNGTSSDLQVLKMVITALNKITKLSWLDQQQPQGIVKELIRMCSLSQQHTFVALQAVQDLITEMGYVPKQSQVAINRRTAYKFRDGPDSALFLIIKQMIQLTSTLTMQVSNELVEKCLERTLCIYEQCLAFDYSAIQQNECDDAPTTIVPNLWRPCLIENPQTTRDLFLLLRQENSSVQVKVSVCQILTHLTNLRQTIFDGQQELRSKFVTMFTGELIGYLKTQNQAYEANLHVILFTNRQIFKEFLMIIIKFQSNFQVFELQKAGDFLFETYLQELYSFTMNCFKVGAQSNAVTDRALKLCTLWYRVNLEASTQKLNCRVQLENNLPNIITIILDGYLQQQIQSEHEEEDENFDQFERTTRNDDLDFLSKLMRLKIEFSLQLMLERFKQLIAIYENAIRDNNYLLIVSSEKQITMLVFLTNSFFSYGLVSASVKLSQIKRPGNSDSISEMQQNEQPPSFTDFQVFSRICYICNISNQLLTHQGHLDINLEQVLLAFILNFKNLVLTDSRIVLLSAHIANIQAQQVADCTVEKVELDSTASAKQAFSVLAQLLGYSSMQEIIEIFASKLINNLMHNAKGKNVNLRIVESSLDVLQLYLNNSVSCKFLEGIQIVRQIASAHISQFQILQQPGQQKQLGQFFRVLTGLWLTQDYFDKFTDYLDQLSFTIVQVSTLESQQIVQFARENVIKIFYILRGILRGIQGSRGFNQFFEWFHPKYFSTLIEATLNAFYSDDEVVHVCIKLLAELADNKTNRLKFDMWNINGLIVFKETAKYIIKLMQVWDCLANKPKTSTGINEYRCRWKYLKVISKLFLSILTGNYVNFSICEFYNDDVFTQLTVFILKMVSNCCANKQDLKCFPKVEQTVFMMLSSFFSHHLDRLMTKVEPEVVKILFINLLEGLKSPSYEVQTDCNAAITAFCEYFIEKLNKKPTDKIAQAVQCANQFYYQNINLFDECIRMIIYVLLFEDNRTVWLLRPTLYSALAAYFLTGQKQLEDVVRLLMDEVLINESDEVRRQQILSEFMKLLDGDLFKVANADNREKFITQFNNFKIFVNEFINS